MKNFIVSLVLTIALFALFVVSHFAVLHLNSLLSANCIAWVYCPDMLFYGHNIPHANVQTIVQVLGYIMLGSGIAAFVMFPLTCMFFASMVNKAYVRLQIAIRKHNMGIK